ncbi:DUF4494 domain-containing protein [Paramuribaculum intestinale]|jgi:hypothetical protein|uniref:DUF4494 family protein n=1 Tax=Paramuribaculum intestinale TaxID=2094151 RepID=UPI000D1DC4C4|nr:DUF4494 family protein [Paramuribaculum intestinale]PWB11821.1 DUF4494 domain-containing protein [Paramuribaculum intestinale]ROS92400.1 DUF4494 domain-containing protein [Muribaculaceae bacterium Isolate-043 (Harlan)]WLT41107.1 DUF4494 domain-containing protein [Paramuribaculum intestinale]
MFFEAKLRVEKTLDTGEQKEVKEHYIMDAELFAEAEKMMFELYPNQKIDVFSIGRSDIREIINDKEDDKPFFKATVIDVFTDDETGKEKETKYYMLVCAENTVEATLLVNEYLKQGYNLRLDGIKRVKIIDYLPYQPA